MPEISRFLGNIIRMFYSDHEPPHFHATYGDREALIEIDTPALFRGTLPQRALTLVLEWAALHREELLEDWWRARGGQPFEAHRGSTATIPTAAG